MNILVKRKTHCTLHSISESQHLQNFLHFIVQNELSTVDALFGEKNEDNSEFLQTLNTTYPFGAPT